MDSTTFPLVKFRIARYLLGAYEQRLHRFGFFF